MGGIAGVFARDGKPEVVDLLTPVLNGLAHRGPDGCGRWSGEGVALGHQILWNTPEAIHETMPLASQEGRFVLTADARLDNRVELISKLGLSKRVPGDIGDGELILRAYQMWGDACPEYLLGDFAFAVWDEPQQRLFCARDHMGLKPLLYHLSPGLFVFASEARAARQHPGVPGQINEGRIADYLVNPLEGIDTTSTFFESIVKLPPAHRLIVSRDRHRLERYWALDVPPTLQLGGDDAYEQAFREVFDEAVRCRLRSHRPVGSMLSGGIDSSSIVCTAKTLLERESGFGKQSLMTFSAISPEGVECVESDAIRAVVSACAVDAHLLMPAEMGQYVGGLEAFVARLDDLFDAETAGVGELTARAAQRAGVGVLFDGLDGDMLVGTDIRLLHEHLRHGRVLRALRDARAFSAPWHVPAHHLLLAKGVKPFVERAFPRLTWWLRRRLARRSRLRKALGASIIDASFAEHVRLADRFVQLLDHVATEPSLASRHRASLLHPFLTVAVESMERMAAAYAFETRSPLLDRRLVAFCLSLPHDQKMRAGQRKWILRQSMRDRVPAAVRCRIAWGEHHPAPYFGTRWFDAEAALIRDVVDDLCPTNPYVDVGQVQRALTRIREGKERSGDERKVWQAVTLHLWLNNVRATSDNC